MGKTWFAVEAKTFEISIEEKNKKLRGCIWERCKGATSWVRFGDSSLQRLLLGIEDCEMISRNQEWFAKWEEEGRSYKIERRSNKAGDFLLCSVRDLGRKSFGICIPEGKGLVRGWKIMAEKLRSLGVGTKRLERQKTNDCEERKAPVIMDNPKSFARVVAGTGFGLTWEMVRVRVGKNETAERLGQLESCLVGWWGGGTSPIPDLKFLKNRVWQTWKVKGSLKVEELRRGLWLFVFESPNEARRILREGTGRLGGFPISLREWGKDVGCLVGRERCKTVWVRLLGLPLHLWSRPILKRLGDRCGGFVAEDENTAFMIDPRWARIRVKWDASSNLRSVVVSEGDRSFVIQLWWEFQPQMMGESRPSKQNRGRETRGEGDVRTRASESMEQAARESVKKTDKTTGALHGEKGKIAEVGGQMDGMLPWEEQKLKQAVEQKEWAASCWCRLGPTSRVQVRSRVREGNNGLGEFRGGELLVQTGPTSRVQVRRRVREGNNGLGEFRGVKPKTNRAQAKQIGPLLSRDPAAKKLSPVQTGLSKNPAEKQVNVEQQSCTISPEWKTMKQSSEVTPINNWKEGGRRVDQDVIPLLENDVSRYVKPTHEDFPSSKISVFGRPLLTGGSSDQEDPLKLKEIDDSVPLRMVAVDGREWGLDGREWGLESSASGESGGSGYENWEDSCLIKFSEFLGFSIVGFESEILGLLRKIVARQHQGKNKGVVKTSRCERELKKLVCTINYDGRGQIKGGDKDRGSIMLRS